MVEIKNLKYPEFMDFANNLKNVIKKDNTPERKKKKSNNDFICGTTSNSLISTVEAEFKVFLVQFLMTPY